MLIVSQAGRMRYVRINTIEALLEECSGHWFTRRRLPALSSRWRQQSCQQTVASTSRTTGLCYIYESQEGRI